MKRCRSFHPLGRGRTGARDLPAVRPGRVRRHRRAAGPSSVCDDPVCASESSLPAPILLGLARRLLRRPRRAVARVQVGQPAGSGNNMTYVVTLPKDPTVQPTASGGPSSTTWNFRASSDLLVRASRCATPSPRRSTPRRVSRIRIRTTSSAPTRMHADYIGKHPGKRTWSFSSTGPDTFRSSRASAAPPPSTARR